LVLRSPINNLFLPLQAFHENHYNAFFYGGTYNMFLACNVTDLNFDGKSTSTSSVGEAGGVNLPTLSTHEAKPKWLKLITTTMFYLLLITNVEHNGP
jgi:hypothetical protein